MSKLQHVTTSTVYENLRVSYGVASILNTFATLSSQARRPAWQIYLINVETLIRNRKENNNSIVSANDVLNDMQILQQYISSYNRINLSSVQKKYTPYIVFYFPQYKVIPHDYLRTKLPKGTEERWKLQDAILDIVRNKSMPEAIDTTQILYISSGSSKSVWPHKDLLKDIRSVISGSQYAPCLMISHVPLDFHLYRYFNDFTLLESYTGVLKKCTVFGKKVFGDDAIPFNKYTHLSFGDKWYMNGLASFSVRRQIKERALKEHWKLLPDKGILERLINLHFTSTSKLIDPDI